MLANGAGRDGSMAEAGLSNDRGGEKKRKGKGRDRKRRGEKVGKIFFSNAQILLLFRVGRLRSINK